MSIFGNRFIWVVDTDDCGGIENVKEIAERTGFGIAAKYNDGDPSDDKWNFQGKFRELRKKINNLPLIAWGYSYGNRYGNLEKEIQAGINAIKMDGADGYIFDIESEWESTNSDAWAEILGAKIEGLNEKMAITTFWNYRYHKKLPLQTLSKYILVVLPQTYFDLAQKTTMDSQKEMLVIAWEDFAAIFREVYFIGEFGHGEYKTLADFIVLNQMVHGPMPYSVWVLDHHHTESNITFLEMLSKSANRDCSSCKLVTSLKTIFSYVNM